jgi:hypothetical protein
MIPRSFAAAFFDDGLGNRLRLMNPSVKTPTLYDATTYAATTSCEIANPKNSVAITNCHHCTYVRRTRFCSATPPARQSQAYSQHASHQQLANPSLIATQRMLAQNPPTAAGSAGGKLLEQEWKTHFTKRSIEGVTARHNSKGHFIRHTQAGTERILNSRFGSMQLGANDPPLDA